MVAALGAPPVLALGAVVIMLAALVITRQRLDAGARPETEPRPGLFREAKVGWAILRGERILWRLTVAGLLINLGSAGLGAIVSAGALGGLVGAIAAVPAATRFGESRVLIGAGAGLPLAAALTFIAMLRPTEALGWLAAGAFAWGLVIVMYNVHSAAVTARLTPPEAMGRVWAARRTITMCVVPAGSVLGGLLADHAGMALAVGTWIAVTALGTAGIISALNPRRGSRAPRCGGPRG